MQKTVTEILNILEANEIEKKVAEVKKAHAEARDEKSGKVVAVMGALRDHFDKKATAHNVVEALSVAIHALINLPVKTEPGIFKSTVLGGLSGLLTGVLTYADRNMSDEEMDEVVRKMLNPVGLAVYLRGGTIGEVFEANPELFV